jgi:hypothetical protein
VGWTGGVADQAVVRFHTNEHGIAFEDGAFPSPKGQTQRLRQGTRHQNAFDFSDFHLPLVTVGHKGANKSLVRKAL